ncbi:actin-like ATPase domain-containing protein [Rickenella mellea]|uniref:Actin-like ATPase domain-containing protein n=1 Tax=Rickenella mellea TaxID=50990 RepID=A0A4Y7QIF8_9AGAM|nr:actin-like ATPase domain-containing protein [Rickenella mellea]
MPCLRGLLLQLCLLFSLVFLTQTARSSVLAVDYGSEFIKASLVKPGVPFDVLLNRDSKRKIYSSVSWKNDDRLFGADGFNIATRFPADSFTYLKVLLGAPFESEGVPFFASISPAELVRTPRDTVAVRRSNGTEYTVEELVAMQLAYIKELAESTGGEKVSDVIVTVPAYYTQFERDAVADAIEIAGMRMLALINDGTAVAINFAMTRTFPTQEYHVIYDAGASSIKATVVSFTTVPGDPKGKSTSKDSTHVSVAGVGFDRKAGGTELDRRLRDMLVEDFQTKHSQDIRKDMKGMAKLWKEAGKVKAILSANTEAMSSVESVAFDIDYRSKVTRTNFEAACEDLRGRFAQPILDAISNAGLTLDDIKSVILAGGHSRTPMVQAAVKAAVGDSKIATSVNADEAAVLGAALYGASISSHFRTKNMKVQDIGVHNVHISYPSEPKNPEQQPKIIHTSIFPAGSKVGVKKTLTFKRKDDFGIKMAYENAAAPGFPTDLLEAQISGVKEAIGNLTERGAIDPVVKATAVMSESGFATIQDAIAFGEIKDTTIAGKLKSLFGRGESSETENSESSSPSDSSTTTSTSANETATTSSTTSSGTATPSSTPDKKSTKKESDTISLVLDVKPLSVPALTPTEIRKAREKLIALDNAEAAKRRREDARNILEGYLYRVRDLLEEDEQSPFMKCSKEEERSAIREKMESTLLWLHDQADEADTVTFWDKRNALEVLERPVQHRYREIDAFPETLNNSQKWNFATRMFLVEAKANLTAEEEADLPSKWTRAEIENLEKTLKEHEGWLNEWVEKQKSVKPNEDPVILTTEMKARAKTLETQLYKLVKRKAPKPKKKTSTSQSSSTSTTSSPDIESSTLETPASSPTQTTTDTSTTSTSATEGAAATHDEL